MYPSRRTMPVYVRLSSTIAVAGLVFSASLEARQHSIREKSGEVGCIVRPPAARNASPGADLVTIDVRVPKPPPTILLAKLPANRHDFSMLPIQVFLVQAPAKGVVVNGKVAQVAPTTADLSIRRLGANPDPDADLFIRVEYPRAALQAATDLVAERTARADNGERVTTQTRCRITTADMAVWR